MPQLPTPWRDVPVGGPDAWARRTLGGGLGKYLMEWGDIQFAVHPLNYHELDHNTETDWAHKEIAGAAIYREWVGENDEQIQLRGRVFPYRIGGMPQLEKFEAYRREGYANQLLRGDGIVLGWYVCEKLTRGHTWISFEGVGQQIAFEAVMSRVPVPQADYYLTQMWIAGGP